MTLKKLVILLTISAISLSCASSKFTGMQKSAFGRSACSITAKTCDFQAVKHDWKLSGTYFVEKKDAGQYVVNGSVILDVSQASPVFQSVQRLLLTFVFFQGNVVVYEETISVKGKANEYLKFSKLIKSDKDFESSLWAGGSFRVTELPAY